MSSRPSLDPYGGRNPLVDRMIGDVYPTVRFVAEHIPYLVFLAQNFTDLRPKEVEFQKNDDTGVVQWRYVEEGDQWKTLVGYDEITGPSIEFQQSDEYLQYRPVGQTDWQDLIPIADISGKTAEMQSTGNVLEWRLQGDSSWNTLLDLSTTVTNSALARSEAAEAMLQVTSIGERQTALEAGQLTDALYFATFAEMNAVAGTPNQGAFVTSGAEAGQYKWSGSAWVFLRPDLITEKADTSRVEKLEQGDFTTLSDFRFMQLSPDSGYVWGVVDKNSRAALLVRTDGSVVLPKWEKEAFLAKELDVSTGFVWAVIDKNDRVALGIRTDGSIVGKFPNSETAPGLEYLLPKKDIWCLGDSMTAGAGNQTTWAQLLQSAYPERRISNWGVGGQTSTQIAARAGAYFSLVSVANNQIPASGSVAIVDRSVNLLTSQGMQTLLGWLGGVYGSLNRNSSTDVYTFTRQLPGPSQYLAPNSPFVPDVMSRDFETMIIFLGRNNILDYGTIKRDIARCVELQKTAEKRFLIITPPNGGTTVPGQASNEGTGSAFLQSVKDVESWAVQEYGDKVLKVREFSFQFNNGTSDDLGDVAREVIPRSLRIDGVHWTSAMHLNVFNWIQNEIIRRGW